jgi:DNA-binding CsgD family transcriptional regulator
MVPPDTFLEDILSRTPPSISLTKREKEILGLIILGLTNRKIAQQLHRTERTVEYHRNHLMHKFNAKTAADLVKRAILSDMA